MIVSWNWLRQYLDLDVSADEFAERVMLAGLNHESTTPVGDDLAIDLEITSNRPDCLGHIGVAREASVLFGQPLKIPAAEPKTGATAVKSLASVQVTCPDLCPRYTARVIRGVKVAASPAWLADRLATVGIQRVNNIVDITNYVLMECGQPLHAFDLSHLTGSEIIVRRANAGEKLVAIDHQTYELTTDMCVIADKIRPVAIGGVMGGAETEVRDTTRDLLIEAALFDPMSIRSTARKLGLHSDSSYRFERGLDPQGVDYASRRACQLILEIAGGELASGVLDAGALPTAPAPVVLRLAQIKRILGIEIPLPTVRRILAALGNIETTTAKEKEPTAIAVVPPSWRRDLTREIDLIEEVARIHGYDKIPEDVSVPMAPSTRTTTDRVLSKVRTALVGAGLDEALTLSAVEEGPSEAFSPWTDAPALMAPTPVLRRADRLRRSLIPSLLLARRTNEGLANPRIELFETAKIYLPRKEQLPLEDLMLGLTSGAGLLEVKGVLEGFLDALHCNEQITALPFRHPLFKSARSVELQLNGERLGFLGELSDAGLKQFELRAPTTVAEVRIALLEQVARLVPISAELSPYPAVTRDLNLVVDESVRWADLAQTVRKCAGESLEQLNYRDTYRQVERLGAGKKSLLFSLILRGRSGTLTSAEADSTCETVVKQCTAAHGAQLRA
ncbi:MAG: phenylalanine--tRNA ligase subunit beta [Planctomycetota bacterium]|nr:phenylalanine--tRNA ligase subunit beta [Planctomycetota bacterium]